MSDREACDKKLIRHCIRFTGLKHIDLVLGKMRPLNGLFVLSPNMLQHDRTCPIKQNAGINDIFEIHRN